MRTHKKYFLSIALLIVVCFSQVGTFSSLVIGQSGFAGGDGSAENPYLVATAAQLNNVRNHMDKHFKQTAHINLGVAPWNVGNGWEPIGTSWDQFYGSFDGNGFAIRNLTINRPATNYQGLFGYVINASLANIRLENVNIIGKGYVGSLAGHLVGSQSERIFASGQVQGMDYRVGGLIGELEGGTLHQSGTVTDVIGTWYTGGLVGRNRHGDINTSYSMGTVQGTFYVGGLAGYTSQNLARIINCYSWAAVYGQAYVGGLLGGFQQLYDGRIIRSYSTGLVSGTGEGVGGLIGWSDNPGHVVHSYWDKQTSNQNASAGGEGRNTAEMYQLETYQLYNFYALWTIKQGKGYPVFQNFDNYSKPQPINVDNLPGAGTAAEPYLISNAHQLNAIRQDLEAHYRLMNDIDLSSTVIWDYGRGWLPIGGGSIADRFKGSFDGNGFTIRNLVINRPSTDHQALFGYIENASIENMRLENVNVTGRNHVGSLASQAINSEISNIFASGQVQGLANTVGGLIGQISSGDVHRTATVVEVEGLRWTGGLVGNNFTGNISTSSSMGTVRGTTEVGGLVGYASHHPARIVNSYSWAAVSGQNDLGGLVGRFYPLGDAHITSTYSTGNVSGTGANIGGLIGFSDNPVKVSDSYWNTVSSGQSNSPGGGDGRTTNEMTHPHAGNTYLGYDFTNTWAQDTAPQRNDGYPYLRNVTNPKRTITAGASPSLGGTVSGGGTFFDGQIISLHAVADPGWVFNHWTEGGGIVSRSHSYTFTASKDRTLVANFVELLPTIEHIPVASGTLYSPVDRTWYDFNPNAFSAPVNFTHTFIPVPPANAPDDLTSLGYHFEVIAQFGDGTPASLVGTVNIGIYFEAAGFRATQPVSLWRLSPSGWEHVPSSTLGNRVLFAELNQFSTFALFEGIYEPPPPDGVNIFLPLIIR